MRLTMLSAGAICFGALIAHAGTIPIKAEAQSSEAGRLLKVIKVNAEQIRSFALNLENLAKQADAKWTDYDQQWNMIKPAQERIDRALWHLENMRASLSAPEQQTLTQTERDVAEITGATRDLWMRLGQPKVDLKKPALNADARSLDKAARDVIKATAPTS
jgi:hypothetical protein